MSSFWNIELHILLCFIIKFYQSHKFACFICVFCVCNCVLSVTWILCVIFLWFSLCHSTECFVKVETIILLVIHVNINNQFTYNNNYTTTICNDVPPFIFVFCKNAILLYVRCVFFSSSSVVVALSVVLIQNEVYKFSTQ